MAHLQRNPRDTARWRKAQQHLLEGNHGAAIPIYQELLRRYPTIAELWFELGNSAAGKLDFPLANKAYRRARELASRNASLLGMIGQQYQSLRQLDEARTCYEAALAADPGSVDARIKLAVWFEKERRMDEAWECVESCLALHPRDDQARYFRAFLQHRRKNHEEAESELRQLIKDVPKYPYVKYAARHLLGVVLDQLGRYDEAIRWLLEAKAEIRTITDIAALERSYDETDHIRRQSLAGLGRESILRWRDGCAGPPPRHRIAFLGGHPRSGTTLMEQILDAHPGLMAFDESTAFQQEIASKLDTLPEGDRTATSARLAEMRSRYFSSMLREVSGTGDAKVLLDKNPSATMSLPSWLRAFPELKTIIALRDPRDVVISCFFLNITLNATNVNFLSLERTVKHYSDLMDVWLRLKEFGGFDWIETRYEDVVGDLEKEGRRVTGFLGLEWHPDQIRFQDNARRKVLYAPTYHDVTQPIHQGAVGRWERYSAALEPHMGKLKSYLQAFGYG
ncbi:sulfotransferase [Luteolibacter yonseiensis]|uniref:Sulfotransferase n=1 Tax=Luteolibacter yonseiensis TaxID=1144680 RepID=A0A934R576_9BACT|nr:sulfotransferase [Luteolibacter yonseiensis]MBK1816451.1 sulfotransferase [Luteolibacter yonseiensis]